MILNLLRAVELFIDDIETFGDPQVQECGVILGRKTLTTLSG